MTKIKLHVKPFIIGFLFVGIGFRGYAEEGYPARIISLSPAVTEELYVLGAEDKLVGCTVYCQRPARAKDKEKVAATVEADLEKIISLNPDLVIASSLTNPKTIKKMNDLGMRVLIFPSPKSFNDICKQFLELAELAGKKEKAEEVINEVKLKTEDIKKKSAEFIKTRVFIQAGADPLRTLNKNFFINDFIEFAGGINIAAETKNGIYAREEVIRENPEVIIIVTMGIAGENEKQIWQKFKTLNAVKNNKVFVIDSYKLCSPTPVTFAETLEEIFYILHKPQI